VIVDDEPAGRDAVRTLLGDVPAITVVAEAASGRDAVRVVRAFAPDLLFLDIQMPDQDGFAVIDALGDDIPRGVVLVTAHSEYAQRAFEVHALDYVVKPFGRPRFLAAVERALRRLEAEEALGMKETLRSLVQSLGARPAAPEAALEPSTPGSSTRRRLAVRLGTRTVLVDPSDVDWIEADGDFVRLHVGDRIHLLKSRMAGFEDLLGEPEFLRIHRSTIVNLARVTVLHRDRDGGGDVALSTGVRLRVARGRWSALERALGISEPSW
jgi:two-component system LytT family response regulator